MPTYEYACKKCDEHLEVVQSFKDDPLTKCPNCGGTLRKVFGNVGIVFKGSGFYKTDSRSSTKSTTSSGSDKSESKSEKSEKSETKTESTASDTKKSDTKKTETKAAAS